MDLSRDDLSFIPVETLLSVTTSSPSSSMKHELKRLANLNRKRYAVHQAVHLPHMIVAAEDVDHFELLEWLPNFITSNRISAEIVDVGSVSSATDLEGKIAVIESADPGYDWVFSRGINGLITKYGGAASHMAIRAAELGLPAAIGCGEVIFSRVQSARAVELDCAGKRIVPL